MARGETVSLRERERTLTDLETAILSKLGQSKEPVDVPSLIRGVAKDQDCTMDDVAHALSRLSAAVVDAPDVPAAVQLAAVGRS